MPSDESIRLHDHQDFAPIEEPREGDHRQSRRPWSVSRPGFAFLKEGKLLAEKQVLGDEGRATNEQQSEDGEQP